MASPEIPPTVSRKRQTIVNLLFAYIAIALMLVQGIVLTPLYLKYVSASLFGAWLATGNVLAWIALVDPGVSRIMQQRVAHFLGRRDMDKLGAVIGTGLFLGTFFSLLPMAAIPFSGTIARTLDIPPLEQAELAHALRLALIGTSLTMATFQPAAANLGLQVSFGAGISFTIASVCGIAATILFLFYGHGLASLPLGMIVRGTLMLALNSAFMVGWCAGNPGASPRVRKDELKAFSALSAFTFTERLGGMLLTQSDVYMTAKILTTESAAVLSFSGRAFEPVRMAADRLAPAFLPGLAHLAGEGRHERTAEIVRRSLNIIAFLVSVGAACVVALNFAFVKLWVGPAFFGGQRLTLAFGCVAVASVLLSSLAEMIFAVGGIGQIEIMRVVEGLFRIVLQAVLLKTWGLIGVPVGAGIGILLVSGWYLPLLAAKKLGGERRAHHYYWQIALHLSRAGALLGCGTAAWYFLSRNVEHWTWLRFAGCAAVVGPVLFLIGLALTPAMREEMRGLAERIKSRRVKRTP